MLNKSAKPVAVVIGATSKWQADGANTKLATGAGVSDADLPVSVRWSLGGALSQKFAKEGFFTVLATRRSANAEGLAQAIVDQGGECMIVEMDLASRESISRAFARVREEAGDVDVLIYNPGYLDGRDLTPEQEPFEFMPDRIFETAQAVAVSGPFHVVKEVLPGMRRKGAGSILFSNNKASLRGRRRKTGESLYYPRAMVRTLAQALAEESVDGIHVANVIVDGPIDSPGVRALQGVRPEDIMDPMGIAEAFFYLHTQPRSCWTYEIQLTPASRGGPSY